MMRRGVRCSIRRGFLGTIASRYTSWNGYWIWGFIVHDRLDEFFNLLASDPPQDAGAIAECSRLARLKFHEQCEKQGGVGVFTGAELRARVVSSFESRWLNAAVREACTIELTCVTTCVLAVESDSVRLDVGRHNVWLERRSALRASE